MKASKLVKCSMIYDYQFILNKRKTGTYFVGCKLIQSFCILPPAVVQDEVPAVPSYISDRYRVGRMLGDGNFAVVRECVELSTGREYALKIINKGKCRGKVNKCLQNEIPKATSEFKLSSVKQRNCNEPGGLRFFSVELLE